MSQIRSLLTGDNFPPTPSDDPDTTPTDDATDTLIVRSTPTSTSSAPGETQPAPEATSTAQVLIPVTGADLSRGDFGQHILFNLGLVLLGFGLVFHSLSFRSTVRREQDN